MIRDAHSGDASAVAEIWNAVIRDTVITFTTIEKTLEEVENRIETGPFLVAEQDRKVLGFATFGPFRSGPGYADAVEQTIYLAPAAQGRGIGAPLLRALETQAVALGMKHLVAVISGSNIIARRFHAKAGFSEVGQMRDIGVKFGTRHDLIFMMKKL